MIWDYPYMKTNFLDTKPSSSINDMSTQIRIFCNLDMINAGIAVILFFISPLFAFILLFTKLPMVIITGIYLAWEHTKKKLKEAQDNQSV